MCAIALSVVLVAAGVFVARAATGRQAAGAGAAVLTGHRWGLTGAAAFPRPGAVAPIRQPTTSAEALRVLDPPARRPQPPALSGPSELSGLPGLSGPSELSRAPGPSLLPDLAGRADLSLLPHLPGLPRLPKPPIPLPKLPKLPALPKTPKPPAPLPKLPKLPVPLPPFPAPPKSPVPLPKIPKSPVPLPKLPKPPLPLPRLPKLPGLPTPSPTPSPSPSPSPTADPTPWYGESNYIADVTGNSAHDTSVMRSHGCAAGKAGQVGIDVLDFGAQDVQNGQWGSLPVFTNGTFLTDAQVSADAEAFLAGYRSCASAEHVLAVAIGTNNSGPPSYVSRSAGVVWAQLVAGVAADAAKQGWTAAGLSVTGANDIEPGFGAYPNAQAWANGYSSVSAPVYDDYGSADGCPGSGGGNQACGDGWDTQDVWYVAGGAKLARALPEIYTTTSSGGVTQGQQWQQISLWGVDDHGTKLPFAGSMTQHAACAQNGCSAQLDNTAQQGYTELRNALATNSATADPGLPGDTDIGRDDG